MPSSVDIIGRSFFGALAMKSPRGFEPDIRVAASITDYLYLRQLRNRVRDQMTNSTAKVGYLKQLRFYLGKPGNFSVYIAWIGDHRAGYLLLRHEATSCFITTVVDERFRRKGIAAQMIRFAQNCASNLTAEILLTNTASLKLHETMGFRYFGNNGRVATYICHSSKKSENGSPN